MKQLTEQHIRSKAKYLVTGIGQYGCQEFEAYHIYDAENWKYFLNMKGYTSIVVYKIIKKTKELKEINL